MYITHVQPFGPFLKIFGQQKKTEAINVERCIVQLLPILNSYPPPKLQELSNGTICLGRYSDGNYYRSRITAVGINGLISVHFIDYGNDEVIFMSEIRLLDFKNPHSAYLKNIPPQASEFVLARVFGQWNSQILEHVKLEICNEVIEMDIEDNTTPIPLIGLKFKGNDYSDTLINIKKFGKPIKLDMQNHVFLNNSEPSKLIKLPPAQGIKQQNNVFATEKKHGNTVHGVNPSHNLIFPNHIRPQMLPRNYKIQPNLNPKTVSQPPLLLSRFPSNATGPPMFRTPYIPTKVVNDLLPSNNQSNICTQINASQAIKPSQQYVRSPPTSTIATFKSNTLNIGTRHEVYCSYVEDGPNLFSVQLASSENELNEMMTDLEKSNLKNLTEKPSLGMACVARFSEDKQLYRAVIMNITAVACHVAYVDYGNSELVSFPDIYEIPSNFLKQKNFAMKFTLSGYKDLHPLTDFIRERFKELVSDKKLLLKVTPLEGAPFVQYCELYDDKINVLHELKNSNALLKYPEPLQLKINDSDVVTVRYVENPKKFFIQLVNNARECDDMMDRLLLHCQKAKPLKLFKENTICAAKFDEDDEWYRAQIIKKNDNKILIKYVDFGNTQSVNKSVLREITPEFTLLPCQAIECCLKGFENALTIADSARIQLEMFSEDATGARKRLKLQVLDKLPAGTPIINLIDENCDPPLNISKRMYKLSMPLKSFVNFNQEQNNSNVKANAEDSVVLNSTAFEKSKSSIDFNYKSFEKSGSESLKKSNSFKNRHDSTPESWRSTTYKQNLDVTTDSWKATSSKQQNIDATTDSWKTSPCQIIDSTPDSWKSSSYHKPSAESSPEKRDKLNKKDFKTNAYNKLIERESNAFSENRKRITYGNEYKREKYSNMKKLIPRFNKQPNNIRGKDQNAREKNSSEGRKFDNSDSSGKFSLESKEFDRKSEEDVFVSNSHKMQPPPDVEEYINMDVEYTEPNILYNLKENVLMAWWVSPFEFYVYFKNLHENLEKLMIDLQNFYKTKPSTKNIPNVNDSVIVRYAKDNLFYRAKILDYNLELNKYRIEFIDFGNRSVTTVQNMWEIEKRFIHLPRIAIRCSLFGIVLNCDRTTIIDKIDLYITKQSLIQCEFLKTENEINLVEIFIDGKNLKESFINDELILPLPKGFELQRLIGQTMQAKFMKIFDLNNFYVQIDGCSILLPCLCSDFNLVKQNPLLSEEFKSRYENRYAPIKVDSVSMDHVLLLTPLINLFNVSKIPLICEVPILSNEFSVIVTHIEYENIFYVQSEISGVLLNQLLDDMYTYYETSGTVTNSIKINCLCAAKSHDGNWYRGYIQNEYPSDPSKVEIRYLDYGNTEVVPKTDIKDLQEEFCVTSALATKIYLPLKSIKKDSMSTINELTTGFTLTIKILDHIHENWIADITYEGKSLIDVLSTQNLAKRIPNNDVENQIIKDNTNRIQHFIEDNIVETDAMIVEESDQPSKMFEGVDAFVSHIDNPERFYLQLESETAALNNLQQNIQIIAPSLIKLQITKQDTYCIAKYSLDEQWYRAKIIDRGSDVITIRFIDFGNTDVITGTAKDILKIMPEELIKPDPYAIFCSLPIKPKDSVEWNEEATKLFEHILEKCVQFDYISKMGPKKFVNLCCDGEDYTKLLLNRNLAVERDIIKSGERCFISHTNSLSDFYIQLESDTNNLELISEYLSNKVNFPILDNFTEGIICTAQFPEDNGWYRAKILFHSTEGTEVLFIDYGNTAFTSNLRALTEEIANLPILSKKCNLYLPENISKWSEEAEVKFQELAAMGINIFDIEMQNPGESITVNLFLNNKNILEDLEPLCKIVSNVSKMSESIVEDLMGTGDIHAHNYCPGKICHINSPNDFYVHFDRDAAALYEIISCLDTEIESLEAISEKTEGKICAAKFPEDEKYYRAKIISASNDGCDVLYIDRGNTSFTKELYELPVNIACIDNLAKHFAMENSINPNCEWNAKATTLFFEICGNSNITFNIEIVDQKSEPNTVILYLNDRNINEELYMLLEQDNIHTNAATSSFMTKTVYTDIGNEILTNIIDEINIQNNFLNSETCPEDNVTNDFTNHLQKELDLYENLSKEIVEEINHSIESVPNDIRDQIIYNTNINIDNTESVANNIISEMTSALENENKLSNSLLNLVEKEVDKTDGMTRSIFNEITESMGAEGSITFPEKENIGNSLWKSLEKLVMPSSTHSDYRKSLSNLHISSLESYNLPSSSKSSENLNNSG